MAGLVSISDLNARRIKYEDDAQAQAAIDDVSAEVRACASPKLDDVETPNTPPAVVNVVCRVIRRALSNPDEKSQEGLGDYNYSVSAASSLLTLKEERLIRKAVGKSGVESLYMPVDLPLQISEQ